MLRRLLARFGYVPAEFVDQAYNEGRCDGQDEVMEQCRQSIENLRAQYSGLERERDHLVRVLANHAALQMPKTIIIKPGQKL